MKSFQLEGKKRQELGKVATKALRKQDVIPCVIYGGEKEAVATPFVVNASDVRKLIYTPEVFYVELNIDGQLQKAVVKDIQFHPVSDKILHMDFYRIFDDRPMTVELPVQLDGLAAGVRAGGRLSLDMRKLKVKGLLKDMPEKLVVEVSALELGQKIQVRDLNFDGLTLLNGSNAVVCRVQLTRAARGAAAKK